MAITSRKIDLFRAGSSRFAAAGRLSATLGEISALRRTPSGDLLPRRQIRCRPARQPPN